MLQLVGFRQLRVTRGRYFDILIVPITAFPRLVPARGGGNFNPPIYRLHAVTSRLEICTSIKRVGKQQYGNVNLALESVL